MNRIFFVLGALAPVLAFSAPEEDLLEPFFAEHCIACHGEDKQKGDVRLDQAEAFDSDLWILVYDQLASGEMPPDDEPQPTKEARQSVLRHVLSLAKQQSPSSTTGLRRLNKREYGNTVRDLLGLGKGTFDPGEYIYEDEVDEGFDTRAESLVISNELLLEYMQAAEKSLGHALFVDRGDRPADKVHEVNLAKVKGTSARYINHHRDYVIGRSGGKAMLHDGESTRTMQYPGRYRITVTASGVDRDAYPIRFRPETGPLIMGFGVMPDAAASVSRKGVELRRFELQDKVEQTFEIETWIDKGHFPYFSFINGSSKPITQIRSNIRRRKIPASAMKQPYKGPGIRISQFKIEGPFFDDWPPQSIRVTYGMAEVPDVNHASTRHALVRRFASRAFRRPVGADELTPYLRYLESQHATSGSWHQALIKTFAAMMASIDFLYIREVGDELGAFALANRLSYFLWSSMPDAELFALASTDELKKPEVLLAQVARMFQDPRFHEFSDSFVDQWLALDTLGSMPPDVKDPQFKAYHRDKLESAMLEETRRYFRHVLQENLSVREFIDSDYSFLNRGLAELYGVPFEGGDEFQRVRLPAEAMRGGLLGHGSVLTLTSNGVETSPVVRGHWVLAELLGTPPPPAPKEVPALTPDLNGTTTVREQLDAHRSDASCVECHRQMDPLGFALEAFDPIGRVRSVYPGNQPVTTHGTYKGQDFNDVMELKQIMLTDLRPFARNLTIRIAEYAKGRTLTPTDFIAVEDIVDRAAANDFRLRDLLVMIATEDLMRTR